MPSKARVKVTREILQKAREIASKRRGFGIATTYFGRHRRVMEALERLEFPSRRVVVHVYGPGGIVHDLHPTEHLEVASFLRHENVEIHVFDISDENLKALDQRRISVGVALGLEDYFKRFLPGARRSGKGSKSIVVSGKKIKVNIYEVEVPEKLLKRIRLWKLDLARSRPSTQADLAICLNLHQSLSFRDEKEFEKFSKKSAELVSGIPVSQVFSKDEMSELARRARNQRALGSAALVNILSSLKKGGYLITDLVEDLEIDPSSVGLEEKEVLDVEPRMSFGGVTDRRKVVLYRFIDPAKVKRLVS